MPFVLETCTRKPWLCYTTLPAQTVPEAESVVNSSGEEITGKRRTPQEQRSKMARILSQSGGNRMSSTENRRWPTDGLGSTANICITSRRLMLITRPRGDKDKDTKVLFHRPWIQKIINADPWIEEVITNPLRMLSSVLGKNKEDNISKFQRMRDQGEDHSTKNCKRDYNGWVKIGWPISRNLLPLDHLRKIGGHMNTNIKTLDGMDTKTFNGKITNDKITNDKIMIGLKI